MKKLLFLTFVSVSLLVSGCASTNKPVEPASATTSEATNANENEATDGEGNSASVSEEGVSATAEDGANASVTTDGITATDGEGNSVSITEDGISVESKDLVAPVLAYIIDPANVEKIKVGMAYDDVVTAIGIPPYNPSGLDIKTGTTSVTYFDEEYKSIDVALDNGVVTSVTYDKE